jgi:hypothetical protein
VKLDLLHPVLDCLERVSLVDSISEHDAHSASIVSLGYGFETFLACGVPDLESDFAFSDVDGFDFEINADGGEMGCHEIIFCESEQHIGFANSTISNN